METARRLAQIYARLVLLLVALWFADGSLPTRIFPFNWVAVLASVYYALSLFTPRRRKRIST
jgi:hypothetical protein